MDTGDEIRQASMSSRGLLAYRRPHAPPLPAIKSRVATRRCRFPDCHKTAKPGGLCISHGGGKECSVENCTTSVVSRGFCVAHGGGKRCQSDGCPKSAQSGGFCWIHGGGKKCGFEGCVKRAQSGGACISHGGGKRCRMDGCNKVVQCNGLCVNHGGRRKCLHSAECETKALANGYCLEHGGRTKCVALKCQKKVVHGDYCSEHHAAVMLSASQDKDCFHQTQYRDERQRVSDADHIVRPRNLDIAAPTRSRLRSLSLATEPSLQSNLKTRTTGVVARRIESDSPFVEKRPQAREIAPMGSNQRRRLSGWPYVAASSAGTHTSPSNGYGWRPCALPMCSRFAKVDGLCLTHHRRGHARPWTSATMARREMDRKHIATAATI